MKNMGLFEQLIQTNLRRCAIRLFSKGVFFLFLLINEISRIVECIVDWRSDHLQGDNAMGYLRSRN